MMASWTQRWLLALLLAAGLTIPAMAQDTENVAVQLALDTGADLLVGDDGDGVAGLDGIKLDPPTQWVRSLARLFTDGRYDWAIGEKSAAMTQDDTGVPADPVTPGLVRIAFRQIGTSDHRLLVIANGYGRALTYRAVIRVDGELRRTDVCTVLPGLNGVEHWPYAFDQITLFDIRLDDWPQGKRPRCE